MPAEKKMLPCPFCGLLPEVTKHFRDEQYSLIHRCKIIGPIVLEWTSKGRCETLWNQRADIKEKILTATNNQSTPCSCCGKKSYRKVDICLDCWGKALS